ncbi:TOBE domain-containing protein [Lacrimispora amygdalina]|uniref:TOBE domain-containing protein n=1 Tax=Lacrimispora amygdalina TaxID=253257 RepID=UPI000BE2C47E|nr:TOBE domain-containing protein [Lacrimispora amygdalina]
MDNSLLAVRDINHKYIVVEGNVYKTQAGAVFTVEAEKDGDLFAGTIRPEDIRIAGETEDHNVLTGTVGVRTFLGKSYQYEVLTEEGKFLVSRPAEEVYEEGSTIRLYLPESKLILVNK